LAPRGCITASPVVGGDVSVAKYISETPNTSAMQLVPLVQSYRLQLLWSLDQRVISSKTL